MEPTPTINSNSEVKKFEQNPPETAGTIAANTPSPLFTSSPETAGTVASSSASSGSSVSYNA